jgi:small subunit ribosomal protein S12
MFSVGIVKPKKPNSAREKLSKLIAKRGSYSICSWFRHKLVKNSEVMIRGGRVPDLPGVRYHLLRHKKDLIVTEVPTRRNRRSKFGVKSRKRN